jgi:hypothetical protein
MVVSLTGFGLSGCETADMLMSGGGLPLPNSEVSRQKFSHGEQFIVVDWAQNDYSGAVLGGEIYYYAENTSRETLCLLVRFQTESDVTPAVTPASVGLPEEMKVVAAPGRRTLLAKIWGRDIVSGSGNTVVGPRLSVRVLSTAPSDCS